MKLSRQPSRRRLFVLLIVTFVLFGGVVARLTQLQVVSNQRFDAIGESQRIRTVKLSAERGSIFDRNGHDLALSVPQKTIWADPQAVKDPYQEAAALAPVLNKQVRDLQPLLQAKSPKSRFAYVARRVDDATAQRVADLKLPGIYQYDESKRFLPENDLLQSVVGRVGVDNEGRSGLEFQYDKQLAGKAGVLRVEQDPTGRDIPGGLRQEQAPVRGDDLVLTIDRDLQFKTEAALKVEIEKANAKGGIAALMDTKTGEVLSLANLSVDDDHGAQVETSATNMALANVYEPGSINKLITISAALQEGLVSPTTSMVVPNSIHVSDSTFSEHDEHAVVPWNTTQIVANSSNVGTIMIGQKLGKERLDKYMRAFGLGQPTGLRFPGESQGLMLDPKKYSGSSLPTIAIGQGVSVTAIQMLAAYNTIANDGVYVPPKLVKATIDSDGEQHATAAGQGRQVVSQETAKHMAAMLKEVVRVGTGTAAAIDGYEVAGKTGTAKKPKDGGYEEGAYVSSFAGFVPAERPQLTAIVMLDRPTPVIYGGLVAGPVFSDVVRYAIQQRGITPVASPQDNYGVPHLDAQSAAGVGEAGAPAGATRAEADAVKESTDTTGKTQVPRSTTTSKPSTTLPSAVTQRTPAAQAAASRGDSR